VRKAGYFQEFATRCTVNKIKNKWHFVENKILLVFFLCAFTYANTGCLKVINYTCSYYIIT